MATNLPGHPLPAGQTGGQQTQPQIIFIQQAPPTTTRQVYENYDAKLSQFLGITRVILAVVVVILFTTGLVLVNSHWQVVGWGFYTGVGYWSSVFILLSGGFGISAGSYRSRCTIITHMVMSILSASMVSWQLVMFMSFTIAEADRERRRHCPAFDCWSNCHQSINCTNLDAVVGIAATLLVIGIAFLGLDITGACLCCKVMCCGKPETRTTGVQMPNIGGSGVTTIIPQLPASQGHIQQGHLQTVAYPYQGKFNAGFSQHLQVEQQQQQQQQHQNVKQPIPATPPPPYE